MSYQTDDLKIVEIKELMAPSVLRSEYPITDNAARCVHMARADVQKILHGKDDRLLVIVGPCSIHDADAASE